VAGPLSAGGPAQRRPPQFSIIGIPLLIIGLMLFNIAKRRR
jgi:hypothetical protein